MSTWVNFFHKGLRDRLTNGHVTSDELRSVVASHNGTEAFHCAFDCVEEQLKLEEDTGERDSKGKVIYAYHDASTGFPYPKTFTEYSGVFRPALGYVWFDFDSHDGGLEALADTRRFVSWLNVPDLFICYSGSKGFHVGVPFQYFGLSPSVDLGSKLNALAQTLKSTYKSLDTTVFNPQRKFRALGSKHPKTDLYKVRVVDLSLDLDAIKELARSRGDLSIPVAALGSPLPHLVALLNPVVDSPNPSAKVSGGKATLDKVWIAPTGVAAFEKCGFLKHCKDSPAQVNEPQWYAALSIVSRFQDGRKQCHGLSHGHPKYSVHECNDKIDQAEKESAPRTCASVSTLWDGCKSCPLNGKINSPVNIFDTRFWIHGDKGKLFPDYKSLVDAYDKETSYKTISDMKTVFNYDETHYVETNPIEIKHYAEKQFLPEPKEKERQEFLHKVLANNVLRRNFFTESTESKINFKNGVLDTTSEVLSSHSPNFGFRNVLPYDYNPDLTCPTFEWWIKDVMMGDMDLVAILQEFMGYVVRGGDYKWHKALWLAGTGRNGKSTFLDVLKELIGHANYSVLSIKAITQDKFVSADLDGKIANFSEETSPEELSDSSQFKNLTGDGDVSAQKKYGDPYKFRNRAKLIMTYNEVPELRDLSPGMMSRPIIVPFEKDLTAEELQDKDLKKKLLAELPGIFNFVWKGWKRLEAQGGFTYSAKAELAKHNVREASCSAMQWIQNYVTLLPIDANSANREVRSPAELYESYKATERFPYKAVKFFRRINEHPQIKKRRRMTRNSAEYFSMMIRHSASFDAAQVDPPRAPQMNRDLPQTEY